LPDRSHIQVRPSGSGLNISPVITHRFPFTEFKEAIELIKSGNWGKIVLDWSNL
jgi:threonine 3-dehydrogenase